jgi:hypothetical protein
MTMTSTGIAFFVLWAAWAYAVFNGRTEHYSMSALSPTADMNHQGGDVRLAPKADIRRIAANRNGHRGQPRCHGLI